MLQALRLKNFRGFRQLAASTAPVTAFLGPNSSGKTTVLHAVRLACDAVAMAVESEEVARLKGDWVELAAGLLVGDHTKLLPLSDWQTLFVDRNVGVNTAFSIDLEFSPNAPVERVHVEVVCANNDQLKMNIKVRSPLAMKEIEGARKPGLVNERLTEFMRRRHPRAVFIPPFYGTVRDEEYRARVVLDRLLRAGDQSHAVRNLVSGLGSEEFRLLNSFLKPLCGAELTHRTMGDQLQTEYPLRLLFQDTNGPVEISSAGAGLINLIALYSSLARWQHDATSRTLLYLLDEPEAHLHPKLQADSAERLAQLVTKDFGAQLLLATHSVDILNRLSHSGAMLVRVDRTQDATATELSGQSALFEELRGWVDLTPYSTINALAARRIVFVEDDTDAEVLRRCAQLAFVTNAVARQAFESWALIPLKGADNASIAALLSKLVASELLEETNQPFRVMVVLDKDAKRTPGWSQQQSANVHEQLAVWSQYSIESLFLEELILGRLVASLLRLPADSVSAAVAVALGAADANAELNDEAIRLRVLALARTEKTDSALSKALRQATDDVRGAPGTWQRGKDRFRFVLASIRQQLNVNLPTSLGGLLTKLQPTHEGRLMVPGEVMGLLEKMTAVS